MLCVTNASSFLVHTFEYLNRGSAKVFHIIFFFCALEKKSGKRNSLAKHIRELEMHQAEKVNIYEEEVYIYVEKIVDDTKKLHCNAFQTEREKKD